MGGLTILTKLLLGLSLTVISLYAFNFYVNNVGANKNREEITRSLMNSVDSYNKLLETEFQRIKQMMTSSSIEIALLNADMPDRALSDQEKAVLVFDIKSQLSKLQITSHYINNTSVYLTSLDQMITINMSSSGTMDDPESKALQKNKDGKIDGMQDIGMFIYIAVPLSKGIYAAIGLLVAVGIWNNYYNALIYLRDQRLFPLQSILRDLIISGTLASEATSRSVSHGESTVVISLKYATIMVSTLPILCVYPFLQKYFVKGVLIGAIKA
jgi:hypothetical protein